MAECQRMWFGEANYAVAGAAERRVNPQDHVMRGEGRPQGGCQYRRYRRAHRRAAKALLHLFKLPTGDAHAPILPAAEKL